MTTDPLFQPAQVLIGLCITSFAVGALVMFASAVITRAVFGSWVAALREWDE